MTHRVTLAGAMAPYAWSINGEYWPNVTPLMIAHGQHVAIVVNHTMMAHPMHLHAHAFQVVAINGAQLAGAVRDTVLVPPMGSVTIAFDADNPGRWAFHCHNLYHMMTGMMTEVRYPAIIGHYTSHERSTERYGHKQSKQAGRGSAAALLDS